MKLERYIFDNKNKLNLEDFKILINGNDELKGILFLCNGRDQIQNKLKGSALKAFEMIYTLMTEHRSFILFRPKKIILRNSARIR